MERRNMFNPELSIGQELKNSDIVEIFKCGNMGGMRRSKKTNTLVLISTILKEFTMINGLAEYFIIQGWVKVEIKILTGLKMLH